LWLHATCNCWKLDLRLFAITRPNFNYFHHFHNYDAIIANFYLLVGWILNLFLSVNTLKYPISLILKVFYNDIRVYFYVCIKIIFTILYIYTYIWMYFVHIMNLKILIWIWNFLFKFKKLIWFLNWYFYFLLFLIKKLVFQLRRLLIEYKNGHFNFDFFLNSKLLFQI